MNAIYKRLLSIMFIYFLSLTLISCGSGGGSSAAPSNSKAITSYSINGESGVINNQNQNIFVSLPRGTNFESLVATFKYDGAKVSVNGVTQVSEQTTNDFSKPVIYKVTAANGSTINYTVNVAYKRYFAYIYYPYADSKIYINKFEESTGVLEGFAELSINVDNYNTSQLTSSISGNYLFATNSKTITTYSMDPITGIILRIAASENIFPGSAGPTVVDPLGKYIYQLSNDYLAAYNTLSAFNVGLDGTVTFNNDRLVGNTEKYDMAITPSGKYAYLTHNNANTISMYGINRNTGHLDTLSESSFHQGNDARKIVIDPLGKYVYVSSYQGQAIYMYQIDQNTGLLSALDTQYIKADITPLSIMRIDPSGKYLYTDCNYNKQGLIPRLCLFKIDQNTGQLEAQNSFIISATKVTSMEISPSGRYIYVANAPEESAATVAIIKTYKLDQIPNKLNYVGINTYPGNGLSPSIIIK
ncbi:MAG: beta-propeller fold lactonase family protein [Neisseriaceae bacterium]